MRRLLALCILLMGLSGCGMDVVGRTKNIALEKIKATGATGKTMRLMAAEYLEDDQKMTDLYSRNIEPWVHETYDLGRKALAKQLRAQREWYEIVLDIPLGLFSLFTGNEALKVVGA